jgi:hypothetical protein
LCLVSDWVAAAPQDRLPLLHQLLPLLQLSLLPEEAPPSQQQLRACTTPAAAQLAKQLHQAAVQCQQQQGMQQQQQQGVNRAGEGLGSADGRFLQHLQQQQQQGLQAGDAAASSSASTAPADSLQEMRLHASAITTMDLNNHAISSNASPSAAEPSTPTWLDCSSNSSRGIGAVVLEAWPGRQRGYQPTRLLVAGGHDLSWRGLKAVELYDPRSDSWSPGPTLPAALPFAGARCRICMDHLDDMMSVGCQCLVSKACNQPAGFGQNDLKQISLASPAICCT